MLEIALLMNIEIKIVVLISRLSIQNSSRHKQPTNTTKANQIYFIVHIQRVMYYYQYKM